MEAREVLPDWVRTVAPIVVVVVIVAGGLWIRSMEARAREKERAKKDPAAE